MDESAELERLFNAWLVRFDIMNEELKTEHKFSPRWLRIWDSAWAEWSELEEKDTSYTATSRGWRRDYNKLRSSYDEMRRWVSEPMNAEDRREGPLWVSFLPSKELETYEYLSWQRTMKNWHAVRDASMAGASSSKLSKSWSRSQSISLRLIMDWWDGLYQNLETIESAKSVLAENVRLEREIITEIEDGEDAWNPWEEPGLRTHFRLGVCHRDSLNRTRILKGQAEDPLPEGWERRRTKEGRRFYINRHSNVCTWVSPKHLETGESGIHEEAGQSKIQNIKVQRNSNVRASNHLPARGYHSVMLELFTREFDPLAWEPYMNGLYLLGLKDKREEALDHASTQMFSYSLYRDLILSTPRNRSSESAYIDNIQDSAPWLADEDKHNGLPFYLWNVEEMRTVETSSIERSLEYICISHTWGRWRVNPSVQVDGVPWLVPQCSKFEVRSLPARLRHAFGQRRIFSKLIWLDLLCIPQDGSPKANEEIARQASIFHNCRLCIAWMHDVQAWIGLERAINWSALTYLQKTSERMLPDIAPLIEKASLLASTQIELVKLVAPGRRNTLQKWEDWATGEKHKPWSPNSGSLSTYGNPSDWFSSLWTLQEVSLCPNLVLATDEWETFSDVTGTLVSLGTILNIMRTAFPGLTDLLDGKGQVTRDLDLFLKNKNLPNGPRQLQLLAADTNLANTLHTRSRVGLFPQASMRECSGSRAPAIMSALGVTEWFAPYTNESSRQRKEVLVLDTYPLPFVREAAKKLGSQFYQHSSLQLTNIPFSHTIISKYSRGTMLPFEVAHGLWTTKIASPHDEMGRIVDHPAVHTWEIQNNGSVVIKAAGIVAPEDLFKCKFRWHHKARNTSHDDLRRMSRKGVPTYPVVLYQDLWTCVGVLLQGRRSNTSSKQYLVRTTSFRANDVGMPGTTEVDWVVM